MLDRMRPTDMLPTLRKVCTFVLFLVLIVGETFNFGDLSKRDEKISTYRDQTEEELNNPFFWAELGELYFDRHRKWNQGGLTESLDCFTWANDLIVTMGGDDVRHSAQFAMTLQKGIILSALGRAVEAVSAFDIAMILAGDSAVDRATVLFNKADALLNLPDVSDPKGASLLLQEAFQLNRCDFETYWKYIVSLKAAKVMSKEEWKEFHLKGEAILNDLLTGGSYSEHCLLGVEHEREQRELLKAIDREGNVIGKPRGIPDSFDLQQSIDLLYWCLYLTADMMGDKASAWRYLTLAHQQAAIGYDYDIGAKLKKVKHLTSIFKDGYWPPPSFGMGSKSKTPVFIVGFFRSGSTLLETMLDAHRDVWGMGEESVFIGHVHDMEKEMIAAARVVSGDVPSDEFVLLPDRSKRGPKGGSKKGRDDGHNINGAHRPSDGVNDITEINVDYSGSVGEARGGYEQEGQQESNPYRDVVNRKAELIVEAMAGRLKEMMNRNDLDAHDDDRDVEEEGQGEVEGTEGAGGAGVKRIVDKMLGNYKNIALIHLIFPEAVILHTVRDPMDTLFSCYKNKFNEDNGMWAHDVTSLVTEYVIYLEIMQHFRNELPRGRMVDVSYESLIASPESVMRKIVTSGDALGLDWDPMVIRHTEGNRTVRTASVLQVNKPVYTSSLGGWRQYSVQLEGIRREFLKNVPRLRAINALPSIHLESDFDVLDVAMNWDVDISFDYGGMLQSVRSFYSHSDELSAILSSDNTSNYTIKNTRNNTRNDTVTSITDRLDVIVPPSASQAPFCSLEKMMTSVLCFFDKQSTALRLSSEGDLYESYWQLGGLLRGGVYSAMIEALELSDVLQEDYSATSSASSPSSLSSPSPSTSPSSLPTSPPSTSSSSPPFSEATRGNASMSYSPVILSNLLVHLTHRSRLLLALHQPSLAIIGFERSLTVLERISCGVCGECGECGEYQEGGHAVEGRMERRVKSRIYLYMSTAMTATNGAKNGMGAAGRRFDEDKKGKEDERDVKGRDYSHSGAQAPYRTYHRHCMYHTSSDLIQESLVQNPLSVDSYHPLIQALQAEGNTSEGRWVELIIEMDRIAPSVKDYSRNKGGGNLCDRLEVKKSCAIIETGDETQEIQEPEGGRGEKGKDGREKGEEGGVAEGAVIRPSCDAGLHWALFLACDRTPACTDTQAWKYLQIAHSVERSLLRGSVYKYNIQNSISQMSQIKGAYNRENGFWPENGRGGALVGSKAKTPVFIVGFYFSGVELLENMLSGHGDVWGMEESVLARFVPLLSTELSQLVSTTADEQSKKDKKEKSKKAKKGKNGSKGKKKSKEMSREMMEAEQSKTLREILLKLKNLVDWHADTIVSEMRRKWKMSQSFAVNGVKGVNETDPQGGSGDKGVKRILDKMLGNYKNIALIHLIFPEAVILHTVRDPMDTLFSCYKNKFDEDNGMWAHDVTSLVTEYVIYLEIMQHFRNELPRGRMVDVSYESLIASPESVMRKIVTSGDALGLDWDPMVMRHTPLTPDTPQHTDNRHTPTGGSTPHTPTGSHPGSEWRKYEKQLQPLVEELRSHLPRLKALKAWPEQYKL